MERQPYFQVGEEVTLVSKSHPEYNGDYVVYKIFENGELWNCRINDLYTLESEGLTYVFEKPLEDKVTNLGNECLWCESALRKKYSPSSQGFGEIMKSLKQNENA